MCVCTKVCSFKCSCDAQPVTVHLFLLGHVTQSPGRRVPSRWSGRARPTSSWPGTSRCSATGSCWATTSPTRSVSTVAAVWQRCGSSVTAVWQQCGGSVTAMWQHYGSSVTEVWQQCGRSVSPLWQQCSSSMAAVWQKCDSSVAAV